jgi:hypothetical protein
MAGIQAPFVDGEGALEELAGGFAVAEIRAGEAEVEERLGELRMRRAINLLGGRRQPLQERRRLRRPAPFPQQQSQGLAAAGQIEIVRREGRLPDRQGTAEELLGFIQPAAIESDS